MDPLSSSLIGAFIRSSLQVGAGVLVAKGYLNQATTTDLVASLTPYLTGGAMYLGSLFWSFRQKKKTI